MKYKSRDTFDEKTSSGFILIGMFITFIFISLFAVIVLQLTTTNFKTSIAEQHRVRAALAVDAATSEAIAQIKQNPSWTGTGSETTLIDDTTANFKATYTTVVTTPSASIRLATVTGNIYSPRTASTPTAVYKYEVQILTQSGGGLRNFSVATGAGGLTLSGTASITGSDVYVNGTISLSGSSSIGTASVPLNIYAAHAVCPTAGGSTYPRACTNGENGQPISIGGTSKMYGSVYATNQTTSTGMSNPGLIANSTAPMVNLPAFDRTLVTSGITSTQTGTAASCGGSTVKTLPANVKITGNLDLSGTCQVTLSGNVWVTGNVTLGGSAKFIVANGLTTQPIMLIDGSSGFAAGGATTITPNTSVTPSMGLKIVTSWSAASCSPDCTNVTGSDLKTSQPTTTLSLGGSVSAPGSDFYALWTKLDAGGNINSGSLAGQTIAISGSSSIIVNEPVDDFTPPVGSWRIISQKRIY